MSLIKKFGYAASQLFTLTGSDYTGYYNIKNGTGYAGKYTQEIELGNYNNTQNIVIRSDKFFDRLPTQNFSLTYNLSDFTFQPSEFVNSNSIDNKLKKAYSNFLDSYRACFMASSNLPYSLTGVLKTSATKVGTVFTWASGNDGVAIQPMSAYCNLITENSKIAYSVNQYSTNNTIIIANSASLMVYKNYQPNSTFTIVFSSEYIETNTADYGSLTFGYISNISLYENYLYVCDSGNSSIYAYDITSVLQEDKALGFKFNLIDNINRTQGGFISPTLVCGGEEKVFVYDSASFTVLFYDTNFNLFNSYKNKTLFRNSIPVHLAYYKIYDQVYVLTADYKLIILDSQANATVIKLSTYGIQPNEVARKLVFSNVSSNIVYLLTNYNIYKKFVSNIVDNIGNYSFVSSITGTGWNSSSGNLLYDMDILLDNSNVDNMLLFGFQQFVNYGEQTVFNTLIK